MTIDEAIAELRKRDWCYEHTHPNSPAFDQIIVGKRAPTESYGPFPQGWVQSQAGRGDTVVLAVQDALRKEKVTT